MIYSSRPLEPHVDRHLARLGRSVADLAHRVVAPAADVAVLEAGADVALSRRDLDDVADAEDEAGIAPAGRRPVAELAERVRAPADDRPVFHHRARMRSAGGDLDDAVQIEVLRRLPGRAHPPAEDRVVLDVADLRAVVIATGGELEKRLRGVAL